MSSFYLQFSFSRSINKTSRKGILKQKDMFMEIFEEHAVP